jgi:CDP-diacylglycerol--glycerol-3-phosphate 3-phosphatidyltransferase
MNIPNMLTLCRILIIPLMVISYFWFGWGGKTWAAALFTLAAITDWVDGYLARKLNQMTPMGAFLDPVADKLIVAAALLLLVQSYGAVWLTVPAMIIIGREIIISALREWMAELGKRTHVAVSMVGKVKTALQMIAIILLLLGQEHPIFEWPGIISLYVAVVLTLWSMMVYLMAAWPELSDRD